MRFFLDNNVSFRHARALRLYVREDTASLVHLTEAFEENTPDPEWIGQLAAERDWIIISGDIGIARKPVNKRAWRESGLTAFFCGDGWAQAPQIRQGEMLLRWWPEILRQARLNPIACGFKMEHRARQFTRIFAEA